MKTLTPHQDPDLPIEDRVNDLVGQMTLAEKVSQTLHHAPAIPRLGVPEYDWWNECLHGVGRAGIATVFPQAIGLAAAWDADMMLAVATAISDEARAKHHEAVRADASTEYTGLTFWTPNINIFRDPRWGRGQETYGEDPYLTARLGVAFVKGLQGDDPRYLKTVATPKHYAVHSGPEADRHHFDAVVDERDLRQTYLPAFQACVQEAGAVSVMGAYNRTNGEACCASPTLLENILRREWGFDGYVVSDCGAIDDIYRQHGLAQTAAEAAALAVKAGCDLNCGCTYEALLDAVAQGLITEETIAIAVKRLFTARFRLGMFDPDARVPYAAIPIEVNDSAANRALALQAARASIVLLKNESALLPLPKTLRKIAVIGPNADDVQVLLSNYNGTPSYAVTPLAGIRARVGAETEVVYSRGCAVVNPSQAGFDAAVALAAGADVTIAVVGLSQQVEGEEGQQEGVEEGASSQGDRTEINLPGAQEALLKALYATGTPLVVVLVNGSAVAINWADSHAAAIVETWYGGEEAGTALADVLFGDYNPGGRLPVTFYKSVEQLPPFEDYRMAGHTYRYSSAEPLYPFGYGLSYTRFAYSGLAIEPAILPRPADATSQTPVVQVHIEVTNVGDRAGDEVVQLYVSDVVASAPAPLRELAGFRRIHLEPGERREVTFTLTPRQLALMDRAGQWTVEPGEFAFWVGGGQPGRNTPGVGGTLAVR
jgi:beta-glucosidase